MPHCHPAPTFQSRVATGVLLLSACLGPATALHAQQTFTVNSIADEIDATPGDGVCATAGGACTLRAAIQEANATSALDEIHFAIPGAGPHTIALPTDLPSVQYPVLIDGFTQPGASPNTNPWNQGSNAVLMVVLDVQPPAEFGLILAAGGSTVRGMRIEGAQDYAIRVEGDGSIIEGNYLLSAPGGTGVFISSATGNRIGGTSALERNVIGGGFIGIWLAGEGNQVRGNLIGVDADGSSPLSMDIGITIDGTGNLIGGSLPQAGNVISATEIGVRIQSGDQNTLQANRIGTDVTGMVAVPNLVGVQVRTSNNTIGGPTSEESNLISGNEEAGLQLLSGSGNLVESNLIGTDATGTAALANGENPNEPGVYVLASGNTLARNTIAFNRAAGVYVANPATGVRITENSIFSNGTLGIDLGPVGVTDNDFGDADAGANNLQNFPRMLVAYQSSSTTVMGFLGFFAGSTASYTLEFFSSPTCDPSDHGEGRVFLGAVDVADNGSGQAPFTATLSQTVAAGEVVTATATDAGGNTSEFAPCLRVGSEPTFVVTTADDDDDLVCSDGHCSLREAIGSANTLPGSTSIHFDIPGAGPHTIALGSTLPRVGASVVIDGYTQPGASPNTNPRDAPSNAALMVVLDASVTSYGLELEGGGSTVRGLRIADAGAVGIYVFTGGGNVIEGNFIRSGAGAWGIVLETGENLVGGTTAMARNVVGGAGIGGIQVDETPNVIQGNLIGLDGAGTAGLGQGVGIDVLAGGTTIGGEQAGAGNVISGNGQGIVVERGAVIQGNFIGTDVTGGSAAGNGLHGIYIHSLADVQIGGTTPGARNVISGNGESGITISGADARATIQGNYIGVDAAGIGPVPNGFGVYLEGSSDNTVGGPSPGAPNIIAHNVSAGVAIAGGTGTAILSNSIFSNGGLGIDLGVDGVTANDAGDGDDGPNDLVNFPVLASAILGSAHVAGGLSAAASTTYTLEFFASGACDASGYGQGERFLGSIMVTTDGSGAAGFSVPLAGPASPGDAVTATATDDRNNTSEFSACTFGVGFDVAVSPEDLEVLPGASGGYEVTVTSVGGALDQDIALTCQGLPSGASCAFAPSNVEVGAASATSMLTVSTTAGTTPIGANDFRVVGTYSVIERTATATISIADFTIAATPSSRTVAGGDLATYTVSVEPAGASFSAEVSLSCSGLPAGASCTFAPPTVTPGAGAATSTLTVSTMALARLAPPAATPGPRPPQPALLGLLLGLTLAAAALLRRWGPRSLLARAACGLWLVLAIGTLACSGESTQPPDPVTTTFTVTGTSGALSHSVQAAVTVQ